MYDKLLHRRPSLSEPMIVETGRAPSLQVFPNPVTDQLYIVIPSPSTTLRVNSTRDLVNNIVEIFDINGHRVFAQPALRQAQGPASQAQGAVAEALEATITINISHLPPGTYILKIGEHAVRLVKQ